MSKYDLIMSAIYSAFSNPHRKRYEFKVAPNFWTGRLIKRVKRWRGNMDVTRDGLRVIIRRA